MISMTRIFDTGQQALEASDKLKDAGFAAEDIIVLTPDSSDKSMLSTALLAGNSLGKTNPQTIADAIDRGRSIVVCQVQFGRGQAACDIMDNSGAVETELLADQQEYHRGTPFSSAMGWPVLTRNPTPFSTAFGMQTHSSGRSWISRTFSELSSGFSFGTPSLNNNAAPLSSKFGMKLLKPGPRTSSFGRPLLSDDATPLSNKLGMKTLSDNATPLSSKLGMPTLKKTS